MIRRKGEIRAQVREGIRGGQGRAHAREYLVPGEMAGVEFVSVLTLEPGASVGLHPHPDAEELYLVLEGSGFGLLDGDRFPVGEGDAYLCKVGHSHGIENSPEAPMTFVAVLTKPPDCGTRDREVC